LLLDARPVPRGFLAHAAPRSATMTKRWIDGGQDGRRHSDTTMLRERVEVLAQSNAWGRSCPARSSGRAPPSPLPHASGRARLLAICHSAASCSALGSRVKYLQASLNATGCLRNVSSAR